MSDEKPKPKPFAVCNRFDDERTGRSHISIDVAGRAIKYADFPITHPKENALTETAALLNSAVAAERRDAVVAKLRELSRTARGLTLANGGYAASEWLAKEADAVERGEA